MLATATLVLAIIAIVLSMVAINNAGAARTQVKEDSYELHKIQTQIVKTVREQDENMDTVVGRVNDLIKTINEMKRASVQPSEKEVKAARAASLAVPRTPSPGVSGSSASSFSSKAVSVSTRRDKDDDSYTMPMTDLYQSAFSDDDRSSKHTTSFGSPSKSHGSSLHDTGSSSHSSHPSSSNSHHSSSSSHSHSYDSGSHSSSHDSGGYSSSDSSSDSGGGWGGD